jgi:hypothetical protein
VAKVIDCAKYLVSLSKISQNGMCDSFLKLPSLLLLADMVSLAKYEKPLFPDWLFTRTDGRVYKIAQTGQASAPNGIPLTEDERNTLMLSFEAFGKASTTELSEIISSLSCWQKTHQSTENDGNISATLSVDDMEDDLVRMRDVIRLVEERLKSNNLKETFNGKDFYYDPSKTEMTDELRASLEKYSLLAEAKEQAYSIYIDNGELVVY